MPFSFHANNPPRPLIALEFISLSLQLIGTVIRITAVTLAKKKKEKNDLRGTKHLSTDLRGID